MRSIKYNFGSDAYISLFKERLGVDIDDDKIDYYLLLDELF
jgi:aminoglycoside phosphotransferase